MPGDDVPGVNESALPIIEPSSFALRMQGLAASAAVVVLSCAAYRYAPFDYTRAQFGKLYGSESLPFTAEEFLWSAATIYVLLLAAYFIAVRNAGTAKALRAVRIALAFVRNPGSFIRNGLAAEDRIAALSTLLKAFFAPMMTISLLAFSQGAFENGAVLLAGNSFQSGIFVLLERHGFWFFMQLICFVDVSIFTFGYLIELPLLRNEIRSVEPTLLGWSAALACYPPFNLITGFILGSTVSDFPQFENPTIHVILDALLLLLMAVYASASVALGWRASNLTHRGIVSRGPYAIVRHPAYISKNLSWWIGSFPIVGTAFAKSPIAGLWAILSMFAWSMLYFLRAVTEEDHLRRVNKEYDAYAARVRYRFIPGII